MISFIPTSQQTFDTPMFSLDINYQPFSTEITMRLQVRLLNTHSLPRTYALLKQYLPSILHSKCFNEDDLPFSQEVRNTEIGHLYEHILLEYLCQFKRTLDFDEVVYNGETSWNWMQDQPGTFYITIDAGFDDRQIFLQALAKSTLLLHKILQTAQHLPLQTLSLPADSYSSMATMPMLATAQDPFV